MDLPYELVLLAASIVFLAGLAQGLTGFGFALVAAPVLLLILQPRSVVGLNLLFGTLIGVVLTSQSLHHISFSRVATLFTASIPGSLLGVYIVQVTEVRLLKVLICVVVIAAALPLYVGRTYSFGREKLASVVSGVVSGVLNTSTSLSGPPVVLFLINQGWPNEVVRATVSTYLVLSNIVGIGLLAAAGVYGRELLILGVALVPPALGGYALGAKLLPRVRGDSFRKSAIILVVLAGLAGMSGELWGAIVSR